MHSWPHRETLAAILRGRTPRKPVVILKGSRIRGPCFHRLAVERVKAFARADRRDHRDHIDPPRWRRRRQRLRYALDVGVPTAQHCARTATRSGTRPYRDAASRCPRSAAPSAPSADGMPPCRKHTTSRRTRPPSYTATWKPSTLLTTCSTK